MVTPKPRPVLYVNSVLVFLQLFTAGATFADAFGPQFAALVITAIAAAQGALAFYQQGLVTPLADPRDKDGVRLVRSTSAPRSRG